MTAGFARRDATRVSTGLFGVGAVVCAVWLFWPGQPVSPGVPSNSSSSESPQQGEVHRLRLALAKSERALAQERKLASLLQRELQDASRQIDELSVSAEKLRSQLRKASPVAYGDQRAQPAPRPSDGWQLSPSGSGYDDDPDGVRQRAAARPDARVSSYTTATPGGHRGAPMQPPGFEGTAERDTRSRLAPTAAVAPPPAVVSFGARPSYQRLPSSGPTGD